MSALVEAEQKKGLSRKEGRVIQIHQKSSDGTWSVEIWGNSEGMRQWFQRSNAKGSSPLQALKYAIVTSDQRQKDDDAYRRAHPEDFR